MTKRASVDYRERVLLLRKFATGFSPSDGYDLRKLNSWASGRKGTVNRYFKAVQNLVGRPHQVKRFRKKSKLKTALAAAGLSDFPRLKSLVIQVPTQIIHDGELERIVSEVDINEDGFLEIQISENISKTFLNFELFGFTPDIVATRPMDVVDYVLDNTDFRAYTIQAGESEVGRGRPTFYNKERLRRKFEFLIEKYGPENEDINDTNSSYYGNWLFGLVGYQSRVKDLKDYGLTLSEYKIERNIIKEKLKNARRYRRKLAVELENLRLDKKLSSKEKKKKIENKKKQISKQTARIHFLIVSRRQIGSNGS